MKHLKYLLLESVKIEDIYQKYYSDIDFKDFNQIVKADPTHIEGKRNGRYIQWLLKLYKNNNLKLEDLYKATEYLELFDKQSVRNKLKEKDIFKYNSLQDLFKAIEPFKDSPEIESKTDVLDKTFVKEFKNYKLYRPRTYEDSCRLGSGTEWCTATGKTDDYYYDYSRKGDLNILISKKNPKEKYQFHLEENEFMDKNDEDISKEDFFKSNQDIYNYLEMTTIDNKIIVPKSIKIFIANDKELNSLKGIEKLINLEELVCNHNNLKNLKGIENLTKLNRIDCFNNKLNNIKEVTRLVNLRYLKCHNNNIDSLKGLENCKDLVQLFCANNRLNNLKEIRNSLEMIVLFCGGNNITSVKELNNLKSLEHLDVSNSDLKNLEGINRLSSLEVLDISNCNINSIEKLSGLENLRRLTISDNPINNIEPIEDIEMLNTIIYKNNDLSLSEILKNDNILNRFEKGYLRIIVDKRF